MSDAVKKNRVIQTTYLSAIGFGGLAALFEWVFGGTFDRHWLMQMALVIAVPFLMIDRLASLSSPRMRAVLGPRFRIFAFVTMASYYWLSTTLVLWPQDPEFIFRHVTIWFVVSLAFGAALAFRFPVATPDVANLYLDLDRLRTGNVVLRTGFMWFPPLAAALILAMASDVQLTDDGRGIGEDYLILQMVIFLAVIGGLPEKQGYWGSPIGIGRIVGAVLVFASIAVLFTIP